MLVTWPWLEYKLFSTGTMSHIGEGGSRRWDGSMAAPTQWTRVWANSDWQWKTGKPGMLQSMGSQRVGYDWAT